MFGDLWRFVECDLKIWTFGCVIYTGRATRHWHQYTVECDSEEATQGMGVYVCVCARFFVYVRYQYVCISMYVYTYDVHNEIGHFLIEDLLHSLGVCACVCVCPKDTGKLCIYAIR